MKTVDSELYMKAKKGTLTFKGVTNVLGFTDDPNDGFDGESKLATDWWRYCTDKEVPEDLVKRIGQYHRQDKPDDRLSIARHFANEIIDRFVAR